jgi:hypothetical protein
MFFHKPARKYIRKSCVGKTMKESAAMLGPEGRNGVGVWEVDSRGAL